MSNVRDSSFNDINRKFEEEGLDPVNLSRAQKRQLKKPLKKFFENALKQGNSKK